MNDMASEDEDIDLEEIYCPNCGACGEEGCCRPTRCKNNGGLYCDLYFRLLQSHYVAAQHLLEAVPDSHIDEYVKVMSETFESLRESDAKD